MQEKQRLEAQEQEKEGYGPSKRTESDELLSLEDRSRTNNRLAIYPQEE